MTAPLANTAPAGLQAGDLVLVPFPFTDLSAAKKRPALLITAPDADGDFIAAAVSTKGHHSGSVPLAAADLASGSLPQASHIRADKLYTLGQGVVVKTFGRVKPQVVKNTLAVLCPAIGCC